MGSELSTEEELYTDLLNSSVSCKADINEGAPPPKKKNIALIKHEIEPERETKAFYD